MKSLCIKTNNSFAINYLLKKIENIDLYNTYFSIRKFNHFTNFIIHYSGDDITKFYNSLSNIITQLIIDLYEKDILNMNISFNYFYFDSYEKKKILENASTLLLDKNISNSRYDSINNAIFKNLLSSHSLYLQSFINFNLIKYIKFLNTQIDSAVNKFLIDKEYLEFVNILKLYIKSESKNSETNHLHLIYKDKNSIIIDDNKNIISCNDNIRKAKYVSDISFSSNDFALNTLLNLVPHNITIHLIDGYSDEFINTLILIFQDKIKICNDCDICKMYNINKNIKPDTY